MSFWDDRRQSFEAFEVHGIEDGQKFSQSGEGVLALDQCPQPLQPHQHWHIDEHFVRSHAGIRPSPYEYGTTVFILVFLGRHEPALSKISYSSLHALPGCLWRLAVVFHRKMSWVTSRGLRIGELGGEWPELHDLTGFTPGFSWSPNVLFLPHSSQTPNPMHYSGVKAYIKRGRERVRAFCFVHRLYP